jgi:hypothetical protein
MDLVCPLPKSLTPKDLVPPLFLFIIFIEVSLQKKESIVTNNALRQLVPGKGNTNKNDEW